MEILQEELEQQLEESSQTDKHQEKLERRDEKLKSKIMTGAELLKKRAKQKKKAQAQERRQIWEPKVNKFADDDDLYDEELGRKLSKKELDKIKKEQEFAERKRKKKQAAKNIDIYNALFRNLDRNTYVPLYWDKGDYPGWAMIVKRVKKEVTIYKNPNSFQPYEKSREEKFLVIYFLQWDRDAYPRYGESAYELHELGCNTIWISSPADVKEILRDL